MFTSIEEEITKGSSSLGIDSYGVSMTTLEEIFLKLGEEEEAKKEEAQLREMNKGNKELKVRLIFLSRTNIFI